MKRLLGSLDVTSTNAVYRFYQYSDGNAFPQIKLYKLKSEKEVPISNVMGEVKKLNDEFKFQIEYAPKNRKHSANTREFSNKFIREYKEGW